MAIVRRAVLWILALFRSEDVPTVIPVLPEPPPPPPLASLVPRTRRKRAVVEQSYGVFWHLEDLLSQKDDYFHYLARLRRRCPEAYKTYSRLGGQMIPESSLLCRELDANWRSPEFKRPSFGMVAIFNDRHDVRSQKTDDPRITPKLQFFSKFEGYKDLQPINMKGDIYELTLYYALRKDKFNGFVSFFVHVNELGEVKALKQWVEKSQVIQSKNRHRGQERAFEVRCRGWKYPDSLEFVWSEFRRKYPGEFKTVDDLAEDLFATTVSANDFSAGGVRVNLYQNGLCGVFNVEPTRTPEFFKDRSRVVTESGKTAPIFHSVKPHERRLSNGKVSGVKLHFRGLRRFDWNGADVLITVPGRHHTDVRDFDLAGVDPALVDDPNLKSMEMAEVGQIWARHIKGLSFKQAYAQAKEN